MGLYGRCMLGVWAIFVWPMGAWAQAEVTSLGDWLVQGDLWFEARYRIETVDQDGFAEDAFASTLRSHLGFETADLNGFSVLAELEDVRAIGNDQFNSTVNGRSEFPLVIDPEDTELNQAYVQYLAPGNRVRLGRQEVVMDNARFFGDVDFRQNQQTFDALMWMNTALDGHRFIYGYMSKARRFLSDENPNGELDMNTHVLNYRYTLGHANTLSIYAYLIDMENPNLVSRSHKNLGIRYSGSWGKSPSWLFSIEYADQSPHADGSDANDADYLALEIAPKFANQWIVRLGYEQLSGDGTYGFQTPLGLNHKFQGLADIFAGGTPATGIKDLYAKLDAPILGAQLTLAYHQFQSDVGDVDYGTEWDLKLTKTFLNRYGVAIQYARYDADEFASDTNKFWISASISF